MALVSTFELLVKPIAPPGSGPAAVARTVVQGYFLTIANTKNIPVRVRLQFTATTPNLDITNTVTIRDVLGNNIFGDLVPTADPRKLTYNLSIPAHDTALVSLLPDVSQPKVVAEKSLEIRGYVEISRASFIGPSYELLLTPEHRGTFLPDNINAPIPDFDQLAYALPTANPGNLYKLNSVLVPDLPLDVDNGQIPDATVPSGEMQQILGMIAQRIDEIEQRMTDVRS
ncbi:MAG TPA: hypothetical protein V6C63_07460 [Allocoleopsis sp.]